MTVWVYSTAPRIMCPGTKATAVAMLRVGGLEAWLWIVGRDRPPFCKSCVGIDLAFPVMLFPSHS